MLSKLNTTTYGILTAVAGFAFLCIGDAFVKKNALDFDSIYAAFFTNIFCIFALIIISLFNGGPKNFIRTKCLKLHLVRGFTMLCVFLCFLYAISRMPIAQAYTIMFSQPFILAILAHFLVGEKIHKHRIIAISIGFIGVIIAFNPSLQSINYAVFAAFLCAFFFACTNIIVKFMDTTDHWMTYIFYTVLCQTPILGIILYYQTDGNITLPPLPNIPWFIVAGSAYAVGLALLPIALKKIDASLVGMIQYTGLLWGSLLGFLLFTEIPTYSTITGAIIIVFASLYMTYVENNKRLNKV